MKIAIASKSAAFKTFYLNGQFHFNLFSPAEPGNTPTLQTVKIQVSWLLKKPNDLEWMSWGLTTRQPLWVILCRLPEKGRK